MSYGKLRLIIAFACLFIFGIFFTITGISETSAAENAEFDFNYMKKYEFEDGMYVKGRVYEIYGEFAVEETYEKRFGITTNKRVSSHFYVVPMVGTFEGDTPMYIAVEISHIGMVEEAEKLMDQTWNYYDNNIEPTIWNEFDIQGKVTPLEGELLDYFYEWFMYGETGVSRADFEPYICPYVITYKNTSGTANIAMVIIAAIGAIGLTVILMLHFIGKNNSKNTYNQYSYDNNTSGTVPPYAPGASNEMAERGFPTEKPTPSAEMPKPAPMATNDVDAFFNDGKIYRIPNSAPASVAEEQVSAQSSENTLPQFEEEPSMPAAVKEEKNDTYDSDDWWRA